MKNILTATCYSNSNMNDTLTANNNKADSNLMSKTTWQQKFTNNTFTAILTPRQYTLFYKNLFNKNH